MNGKSLTVLPVVVVGKDRTRMTCAVLDHLKEHIKNATPYFICVSDRSRAGHDAVIEKHLQSLGETEYQVLRTLPEEDRYGWGAAINIGLECAFDVCKESICALVVDNDWLLQKDLDIDKYLYAFTFSNMGAITFKPVNEATNVYLEEHKFSDNSVYLYRSRGAKDKYSFTAEIGTMLLTKRMYQYHGKFKENCITDETEWEFCNWYNALPNETRTKEGIWYATDKDLYHEWLNGEGHVFTHVGLKTQHEGHHNGVWTCPPEYEHLSNEVEDEKVCAEMVEEMKSDLTRNVPKVRTDKAKTEEDNGECFINWGRYFDKVYCMCLLDEQKIRLPRLIEELRRVDLLDSPVLEWRYDVKSSLDECLNNVTGWHTDLLSYRKIAYNTARLMREALLLGYKRIMVIEDDIAFLKDKREIKRVLDTLPDAPVIQLDKFVWGEYDEQKIAEAKKSHKDYTTEWGTSATCNVYTAEGMQLMIEAVEQHKYPVDWIGRYASPLGKYLVAMKPLAVQVIYSGCGNIRNNCGAPRIHDCYRRSGIDEKYSEYAVPEGYNMQSLYNPEDKKNEMSQRFYERDKVVQKGRKFVSVYAIAKNEASVAARWYESVKEADEVCVLDTGSTDDTVNILRDLGAHVEVKTYDEWSFSVARNDSMKLVSPESEIMFTMDLDETIAPGWRKKLEDAWIAEEEKGNKPIGVYYKFIWSFYDDGREMQSFAVRKIHAHGYGHWKYRCHEILCLENGYTFFLNDFVVEHHQNKQTSRSKYLGLLEKDAREMPEDDRSAYYYARELYYEGRWEDAITEFKRHIMLRSAWWNCERASSMRNIAYCYHHLGKDDEYELWLWKAADEDKTNREATFFLGQLALDRKDYRTAVKVFERCLEIKEPSLNYISMPVVWTARPWFLYAQSLWWVNRWDDAVNASKKALDIEPNNNEVKQQYEDMKRTRDERNAKG